MSKGFLIIDGKKNTLFMSNQDFSDLIKLSGYMKFINQVVQHKDLKSLDAEIRDYIKERGRYE